MARARQQPRTLNTVAEQAIKVLQDQFDTALLAEWNIETDFRNVQIAMHPLRNRCIQCKKPFAGTGDTCCCRTRIEIERVFANPLDALLGLLAGHWRGFSTSTALTLYIDQITKIAIANNRDLAWVRHQIERLRPSLSRVYRKWIFGVCQSPFRQIGQLPAWLKNQGDIVEKDLFLALGIEESETEIVRFEAENAQCFESAKTIALDRATIQLAQVSASRVPQKRARQDLIAAMIAKIKRDNPGQSAQWICQELDKMKCPLRAKDRLAGFTSWQTMWKNPKHRNRIKRFISAVLPAAPCKDEVDQD
jgi:hypothetical protein